MLRKLLSLRMLVIPFVAVVSLPLIGYMVFISPHRASWELNELQHEYSRRYREVANISRRVGNSAELLKAKADFEAWQREARNRCMEIAAANLHRKAGATALMMVARRWPDSAEAKEAHAKLLDLTKTLPIDDLGWALNDSRVGFAKREQWRPFVAHVIERARHEPVNDDSAWVLAQASCLVAPDRYSTSGPCEEFDNIAELIRSKFAACANISNFCETVGDKGEASRWGLAYEPHLRDILAVNNDRFVRCSAKFSLAAVVKAAGIARQTEAGQLFKEFLKEFDGQTEYLAQAVEVRYREESRQILERIRLHGQGKSAVATAGIDLDGRPMSLSDYRGKVVLLSFWATWCGPCMQAMQHEKELVETFDPSRFAIVGVNGDSDRPERALAAVHDHGITWRSFQNKRDDATFIDREWHIGGWPTFYLLDANGVISNTWLGLPPPEKLQSAITDLIDRSKQ